MTSSASSRITHFEWIDVLRGLSALAVVLHHARVDLWVGWNAIRSAPHDYSVLDGALAWLSVPTPFFGSAVMLFFLVSGFCVHLPHAAGKRPFNLAIFAHRRLWRIYPPYLAAIGVTVGVELVLSRCFGVEGSGAAKITQSIFLLQNYGSDAGQMIANPSLWSLPVEFELYLFYSLFLWVLIRFGLGASLWLAGSVSLLALAIALSGVVRGSSFHPTANFALFWIIWCTGAALAELVQRGRLPVWKSWMSAVAVLALGLALGCSGLKQIPTELGFFAWSAFFGAVLLWGLTHPNPLAAVPIPGRRLLRFLGTISYSLYLIHFPLFRLCGALWVKAFGEKPASFAVCLVVSLLALPLAWLFYLCIELPSHRMAKGGSTAPGVPLPMTT